MFSEQTSSTIAILIGAILVVGTGIGLPSMNTVQALSKITISQANVATDACTGITNCVNAHTNLGQVLGGAPLATQNINVDGSQNIDQSNTCDDDDLGVPGAINCVNDAATIGNLFVVDNLNGAGDVQVDSFEQASTQANDCQLFDNCINVAGNILAIAAEDIDGPLATDVDVFVGSEVYKLQPKEMNVKVPYSQTHSALTWMSIPSQ